MEYHNFSCEKSESLIRREIIFIFTLIFISILSHNIFIIFQYFISFIILLLKKNIYHLSYYVFSAYYILNSSFFWIVTLHQSKSKHLWLKKKKLTKFYIVLKRIMGWS